MGSWRMRWVLGKKSHVRKTFSCPYDPNRKTIQTISLLAHLACDRGIWGPHLIEISLFVALSSACIILTVFIDCTN
jgi:hypothetical protein